MTDFQDFVVLDVAFMLKRKVTITDNLDTREDPDWNREAAETQYIFAEFLSEKGLLIDGVSVARQPDLAISWSQLTEAGQKFVRSEYHKWLQTIDQSGTTPDVMENKLQKRWIRYLKKQEPKLD